MERIGMVEGAPAPRRSSESGRFGEALRSAAADLAQTPPAAAEPDALPEPGEMPAAALGAEQESQSMSLEYLKIQAAMQRHSQQFAAISNVMKVKHDTAKAIIQNVH